MNLKRINRLIPAYAGMTLLALFILGVPAVFAEVSIETSVNRSALPVGEQLVLDIIVSNAEGRIEQPKIGSLEGFTSYSQGHSQEFSIINGRTSSRSVYSYVLVANDVGQKIIGPFVIMIGDKEYRASPIKVDVTQTGAGAGSAFAQNSWTQPSATSPPSRALPGAGVGDQDIFVKAWLDKDEVYVNEPVMLTYTLFTRLSATYKGFEKEPVTTGFWVEDFPPEKTVRRTEQFLNGQRYVVADVRKLALFPTQAGAFTVEPGTLSATVEIRNDDAFQTFFSSNIFGSRRGGFPSMITSQVVPKVLVADPVRVLAKVFPETGKPKDFSGAVGQYQIESSLDKTEVEAGDPVTLRIRIYGRGNINTVQNLKLPKMEDFKVYETSSSTNISKEKLIVEGERVTETVIVPRKPGTYEIPSMSFSYFEPKSQTYQTLKTQTQTLRVSGTVQNAPSELAGSGAGFSGSALEPVSREEVGFVAKDIRFIRTAQGGKHLPEKELYRTPIYWGLNGLFILIAALGAFFSKRRATNLQDTKGFRLRRSHGSAKAKLKVASGLLKESKRDAFYEEVSKAIHGYFADKFNISPQNVTQERLEELAGEFVTAELMNKIKKLFDEASMGRFGKVEKKLEDMQALYDLAEEVIVAFEKVKLK
jgi:hypothetical protein